MGPAGHSGTQFPTGISNPDAHPEHVAPVGPRGDPEHLPLEGPIGISLNLQPGGGSLAMAEVYGTRRTQALVERSTADIAA